MPLQWTGIGKYTCLRDSEIVTDSKTLLLLVQHLPVPPFFITFLYSHLTSAYPSILPSLSNPFIH